MKITTWFAHNPVAANLLMIFMLLFGVLGSQKLPTEIIPSIDLDWVSVSVPFKGLTAQELESSKLRQFENIIMDMPGVKTLHTEIQHGQINFRVLLHPGSSSDHWQIKADIRSALNQLDPPEGSDDPVVEQVKIESPVTQVFVSGDYPLEDLAQLTSQLRLQFEASEAIGTVRFFQDPAHEVRITLDPTRMHAYNIQTSDLIRTLKEYGQSISIGQLNKNDQNELKLVAQSKSGSERISMLDIPNIPIHYFGQGGRVLLSDVAKIEPPKDLVKSHRMNGQSAYVLSIFAASTSGLVEATDEVDRLMNKARSKMPEGVQIGFWQNTSKYYKSRSLLLRNNGISGLLMLMAILSIAMAFRVGFWVALGIPIAFCGALGVLWVTGQSMNMVTQFAFILVMGVLVDDAIIVGESIYSLQSKGYSPLAASVFGVQRVIKPVFVAVMTTVIMFLPLLFLPGDEGRVLKPVPIVVVSALVFSFIESTLVLPAHLQHATSKKVKPDTPWYWVSRLTAVSIRYRLLSLSVLFGSFLVLLALLVSGRIEITFFSDIDADIASARIEMLPGARLEQLEAALDAVEEAALTLQAQGMASGLPSIQNVLRVAVDKNQSQDRLVGIVGIEMSTEGQREVASKDVGKVWKEQLPQLPGVDRIEMNTSLNHKSQASEIRLKASRREDFTSVLPALKDEGFFLEHETKPHLIIQPNGLGYELGFTASLLARQVNLVTDPPEVFQIQTALGAAPVLVHWPDMYKNSVWGVSKLPFVLEKDQTVPLGSVAHIRQEDRIDHLTRMNGQPTLMLTDGLANRSDTTRRKTIQDQLDEDNASVQLDTSYFQSEQQAIESYLGIAFCFAVMVMYSFIASMQKSYLKPLLILMAVPFGAFGAILGHFLVGLEITLYSMIGTFAVTGIVVNDNLVLIDEYQQRLARGESVQQAILGAVASRGRPVILTTLTTVIGILPLVLDASVQAQFLKPMALSLCFGIVMASCATLFFVPLVLSFSRENTKTQDHVPVEKVSEQGASEKLQESV